MNKKIFFGFLAIIAVVSANALPFNSKLTDDDKATLDKGEVLIKSIDKYKNVSIEGENEGIKKIRDEIADLSPNYLAEIVQVRPFTGNENLASEMRAVLEDIPSYAGIQYWSVQHDRFYDLYSSAEVKGKTAPDANTVVYESDLYMEPFGTINAPIKIEQTDDYLLYVMENTNALKFNGGITCIKKQHMKSAILLLRDGDNWVLYGLGGAKTYKIAGLQKRVETSLINRIKTFCNYVFTKI